MSAETRTGALPSDVFFHRFSDNGVVRSYSVEWITTQDPSQIFDQTRNSFLRLEVGSDGDGEMRDHEITPVSIMLCGEPEQRSFSSAAFLNSTDFVRELPDLDETLKEATIVNRYAVYGIKY